MSLSGEYIRYLNKKQLNLKKSYVESQCTVDPHLSEPQLSDFPDYLNANFKRSNEIFVCI